MSIAFSYPIFGSTIACPHCRETLPALTLTDIYLCQRHGAFEADGNHQELVHLQSGRRWRQWQGEWFRQHTHVDGIRFEIHEELDRLRAQGIQATHIFLAERYRDLITPYLDGQKVPVSTNPISPVRLYGLPVVFISPPIENLDRDPEARWQVINFELR
jgi:uncharacterized protein (TIGR02652 family)